MLWIYAVYFHFLNIFFTSWSSFRLNRVFFFKCMIWQSIFLLFCFFLFFRFFHSHDLSTSSNDAVIDDLLSRSISSHVRIISERLVFWFEVARITSVKRKMGLKSIPEKWAIFGQCVLRHQSRWFQSITILGFCFAHWKGFDRLEAVASLDAYQITNYQFLSKLIIFLLPDFRKIWEIGF